MKHGISTLGLTAASEQKMTRITLPSVAITTLVLGGGNTHLNMEDRKLNKGSRFEFPDLNFSGEPLSLLEQSQLISSPPPPHFFKDKLPKSVMVDNQP